MLIVEIAGILLLTVFAFAFGWSCCECQWQERELAQMDHDIFSQSPPAEPEPEKHDIRRNGDGRRFRFDPLFDRWEEL